MTGGPFTRRGALGLFGAGAAALSAPSAMARAALSYEIVPMPVAAGAWMIEGSRDYFSMQNGGAIVNSAVLQGESGLILVDSGPSLRYGEALARTLGQLDLRGVSTVVNTHHHPDHYFGNQVFADRPILALGQTGAEARAHGDGFADNMYRLLGDWMRGTEPVPPNGEITPGDVRIDGRPMRVLPLAGHTAADLALLDLETGLLIAGDLAFLDRAPTTPSADVALWQESLAVLRAEGAAAVLPGHGPLDPTGRALDQTGAYLDWLDGMLRLGADQGLDMVELMQTPLPESFAAMGAQPQEFHRSVVHLYPGIEREVLPLAN